MFTKQYNIWKHKGKLNFGKEDWFMIIKIVYLFCYLHYIYTEQAISVLDILTNLNLTFLTLVNLYILKELFKAIRN